MHFLLLYIERQVPHERGLMQKFEKKFLEREREREREYGNY